MDHNMGHHINLEGEFQSDKNPKLKPDQITLNFRNPASHPALAALAESYKLIEPGLTEDIRIRLVTVVEHPDYIRKTIEQSHKKEYLNKFVQAILHGNDEHKKWLIEAASDYNKGWAVKRPRG